MFQLIHYRRTEIKGKYAKICTISYTDEGTAKADAETLFEHITDPEYAGYAIKNNRHTVYRRLKVRAL